MNIDITLDLIIQVIVFVISIVGLYYKIISKIEQIELKINSNSEMINKIINYEIQLMKQEIEQFKAQLNKK